MSSVARIAALIGLLAACDTAHPTYARVRNDYPSETGMVVSKVWWSVALFAESIASTEESEQVRVVPATESAYALLTLQDGRLLPVRTANELSVARGKTLVIDISESNVLGDCEHGVPLSQEDADFITQRIFPDDFEGVTYDAATCTAH